jgi:hypothetical protein
LAPLYSTKDGNQFILGATASDHPTLWFYLPYAIAEPSATQTQQGTSNTSVNNVTAELWLEEYYPQTQEYSQRTILTLPDTKPGIIGIPLPATEPPLVVGKTYHWIFVVRCDPDDASTNKFTELSLRRIQPSTRRSPIATASLNQQLDFYIQNGLWAETMSLCNYLHNSLKNTTFIDKWSKTIQAVPFSGIDSQYIVQECTAGNQTLLK